MILNGKTLLALDGIQVEVLLQALSQYHGPYGSNLTHLGPVQMSRHSTMKHVAQSMQHEIESAAGYSHAQD